MDCSDPTVETYEDLNRVFRVFNQQLFRAQLTPCLITLRATGRSKGSFHALRFVHDDGRRSHEIALNPEYLGRASIEQCLSTLAHEMVHQAQFEAGTAARRGYHNSDFASRMAAIGLPSSATGLPGGKAVGEHMSHYIEPDGSFERLLSDLCDAGFRGHWARQFAPEVESTWAQGRADQADAPVPTRTNGRNTNKQKFLCPSCGQAAWGKPALKIVCGVCSESMFAC